VPVFPVYHAHIYFNADTFEQARALCERADQRFKISVGHMHRKAIGPHPEWSCQLSFSAIEFCELVPWLAKCRSGLSVLVHPVSGDDQRDHDDYAIWLGKQLPLKTDMF